MTISTDLQFKVRLDKWLWVARFFKTRILAQHAIEGGKVRYNGQRAKSSRIVQLGAQLTIRQGASEKEIIIMGLNDKRGSATIACQLYKETSESLAKRSEEAETRKISGGNQAPHIKPNKKQRRQLRQLKTKQWEEDV